MADYLRPRIQHKVVASSETRNRRADSDPNVASECAANSIEPRPDWVRRDCAVIRGQRGSRESRHRARHRRWHVGRRHDREISRPVCRSGNAAISRSASSRRKKRMRRIGSFSIRILGARSSHSLSSTHLRRIARNTWSVRFTVALLTPCTSFASMMASIWRPDATGHCGSACNESGPFCTRVPPDDRIAAALIRAGTQK